MSTLRFKIYYAGLGFGLKKDAELLQKVLIELGYICVIKEQPTNLMAMPIIKRALLSFASKINFLYFYKKITRKFFSSSNVHAFHLENIYFQALFGHEHHILIPNQEWFGRNSFELMPYVSKVWCKTLLAQSIFSQFYNDVSFIGFYSEISEHLHAVEKSRHHFYTRIGNSRFRGAELLVSTWKKNPVWPVLKIVIPKNIRPLNPPLNVEYIDPYVDNESSHELAATSLFHIYMTETEGFGHSIVEALGYGSLIIVTDAPPMNEVVNTKSVIGVRAEYAGQKMLSPRFKSPTHLLEESVERALAMDDEEINTITQHARNRFAELESQFKINLASAIKKLE